MGLPTKHDKMFIRIMTAVICIIGSMCQLYHISEMYFSYPTTVVVNVEMPNRVELPAVTICIPLCYIIKKEMATKKFPWYHQQLKAEALYSNRSIDAISFKEKKAQLLMRILLSSRNMTAVDGHHMTANSSDIIFRCNVHYGVNAHVPCKKLFQTRQFIAMPFSGYKCYTLFPQTLVNRGKEKNRFAYRQSKQWPMLYSFWLYLNGQDYVMFYNETKPKLQIHSPHIMQPGDDYRQLEIGSRQGIRLTYSKIASNLLPPPYPTNCRNYSHDNYESRRDCIDHCIVQVYRKACGVWHQDVRAPISENVTFSSWELLTNRTLHRNCDKVAGNNFQMGKGKSIMRHCEQRCHQDDCISEYYTPIIKESYFTPNTPVMRKRLGEEEYNYFANLIELRMPDAPDIICTHHPKLETVEFLCYIGSIFSMWYGISILSLALNLQTAATKLKSKCFHSERKSNKISLANASTSRAKCTSLAPITL